MQEIKNVIFDIGNVLIDFCWKRAFDNMNLEPEIWERLRKATVGNQAWNEFDRGILSEEEILDWFIRNDPEIESVIRDFMENHYSEIIEKFDYANNWVRTLKEHGFKIYFLSNFSRKGFEVFDEELNFVKDGDGAIISYEVNQIKPDRDIYESLLDTYKLNPKECVFIDDTEPNLVTAREFGINTIHFEGYEKVVSELKAMGVE